MSYTLHGYWQEEVEEEYDSLDEAAARARELLSTHPSGGFYVTSEDATLTLNHASSAVEA